ncbi:MAG: hypothetical protein IPM46_01425 [Flavobacteriales bacterium]|nr:hypothetical protein [Flavobacteriales bacterium]
MLTMARDLGFMAITAAPEPVSEVDALYFLGPQNGRLVVRNELRVGVKYDEVPVEGTARWHNVKPRSVMVGAFHITIPAN